MINRSSNRFMQFILVLAVLILPGTSVSLSAQPAKEANGAAAAIDELLSRSFKPDGPGAAVIVVKNGGVIFRKGYGLANLELGIPIEPDMIFRIGSITKQFTAVATLMLVEQGKLSLDDEITKFIPDYPTQGHKITIDHLLTHSSGIKSYTGLPEWRPLWRKDVSLDEMIDLFKNKPFEFAPGEGWNYNNSGYVLLGRIIEKASGQKYEDFIEKNIFAPLGMKQTFYDNTARIIPRRITGYSRSGEKWINSDYLSMSWPHAAGAIISSVDDLAKWDAALYTDKLVKQDLLRKAWTPYRIKDGRSTKYGYGWMMSEIAGMPSIEHGGGINGFTTIGVRIPSERIYVAILTNRDSGTGVLGQQLAAMAAGRKIEDPVAITLPAGALDKYIGVYKLDEKREVIITKEGETLFMQHPNVGKQEMVPSAAHRFFAKRNPSATLEFTETGGRITKLVLRLRIGPDDEADRTDKPLPKPKEAAAVDPALYDKYAGQYELMPNFILTLSRNGDKLMGQATGQPMVQLVPESPTAFVIQEAAARIEIVLDEKGNPVSLILHQGGQKLPAKKIK
ncbi:MAG: serine hydrolase [Acidobacteriota bacterium]|nr:MAG: serine hydrolase [Acidobacteriota bacterium]